MNNTLNAVITTTKAKAGYAGDVLGTLAADRIATGRYNALPATAQSWYKPEYDKGTLSYRRDTLIMGLDAAYAVACVVVTVMVAILLFQGPLAVVADEAGRVMGTITGTVTETRHAVGGYLSTFEWSRLGSDIAGLTESLIHGLGALLSR